MKKVLNIILIIVLVISLLTFGGFYLANKTLNTKTTTKELTKEEKNGIGANYNIKGDKKLVTYAEINDIDHVNPTIAHQYLDADLTKYNIPLEALDYVLKEDDYQGMYYDYRTAAISYLTDNGDKPTLDIPRILTMTEKGLINYNNDHEDKLDVEKIKSNVEEVANTIDTKIEELKNNKSLTSALKLFTNKKIRIGSLILSAIIVVALFIINGLEKGFKNNSYGFIISGALIMLVWLISKIKLPAKITELIGPAIRYIQSKSFAVGLIYFSLGVVLLLISIAIARSNKTPVVKETKEVEDKE